MSVAIFSLIGFTLKLCNSGRRPRPMLPSVADASQMPDAPAWRRWQWAHVWLFCPRRCHREKRDTCSDAHRTSVHCVSCFWPRRPGHMQWNVGHMQWCAQHDAISRSLGLWRVVSDRQKFVRAVAVEERNVSQFSRQHGRLSCVSFLTARWRLNIRCSSLPVLMSVFSDGTMSHSSQATCWKTFARDRYNDS